MTQYSSDLPVMTAGLGLRRSLMDSLIDLPAGSLDFMEVAPENWINLGGRLQKKFRQFSEQYPIYLHGLSLNIGGIAPLDQDLLLSIKAFMAEHGCPIYTEHLTYCGDDGHLYDLMPIPFTEEAVKHVVARVKQVQDVLGQRIALENASYYCAPDQQMSESEFINAVITEADCDLLLDVNNIYVNSINHRYDAYQFLESLPLQRARYIHIAGHYDEAEDLRVDTHGADVIDPVWAILASAYQHCGPLPTLLERDFNFPPMVDLLAEVEMIRGLQLQAAGVLSESQQSVAKVGA
ncbi:DUF692 domain-containing protein [Oceanicoccus sp. KOV_DT_Chl]|uniref:HvfB family MNIO-type RiPP peptide maturase n=1 Tax=Oceanicoccus sp. KOV_DT_Chl TaxID=1904639 RepID=UPI000C7D527F|nr:DUF692 domain-containing protein [Oceanicoccus sp. KOV_DT_Chl]